MNHFIPFINQYFDTSKLKDSDYLLLQTLSYIPKKITETISFGEITVTIGNIEEASKIKQRELHAVKDGNSVRNYEHNFLMSLTISLLYSWNQFK